MTDTKESTALAMLSHDKSLGQIFVKSGFFSDTKEESQAIVKILAGREVGLQPIEAMTGIHIVKGKITLGANLMAAAIKKSGKYNYRVTKHTDKECVIDFYEGKDKVGTSGFTIDDARKADVYQSGGSWDKYPRNMLFARALSNGVKWYCPDVFGHSPVYVPEEMGVDVNEEGEPLNITPPQEHIPCDTTEEYAQEPTERPELSVIPNRPMPYLTEKDNAKNATETPSCDLQLPPSIMEKIKDKTSREAFTIIDEYAFQDGQAGHLKKLVEKYCPEYFEIGMAKFQIPESALIVILKEATGITFKKSEKPVKCKKRGCKNNLTEPEAKKRDGMCMEHFVGDTEDD